MPPKSQAARVAYSQLPTVTGTNAVKRGSTRQVQGEDLGDHTAPQQVSGSRSVASPALPATRSAESGGVSSSVFSASGIDPPSQVVWGFKQSVYSVVYSPDGASFATADTNGCKVRIFRCQTGYHEAKELCSWDLKGRCYGLAYSPRGDRLATACYEEKNATVWDVSHLPALDEPPAVATTAVTPSDTGHTQGVHVVSFSPDGKYLVTGSWDSTARVWDARTGKPVHRKDDSDAGHRNHRNRRARSVAEPDSGDPIVLKGHEQRVVSVEYWPGRSKEKPPEEGIIATASFDGTVKTWEAETGDLLHTYRAHEDKPHQHEFPEVHFSPDGSSFATNGDDGSVKLFSVPADRAEKGGEVGHLSNRKGSLHSNAIRPSMEDRTEAKPRPYNMLLENEEAKERLRVSAIAYSADGCMLATGHADAKVRLWDLALGEIVQEFHGHTEKEVWSIDFPPKGYGMLTGGGDGTARVWSTRSNGYCAGECGSDEERHKAPVTKVVYAPDGKTFVSTGFDNTVRLWDAEKSEVTKKMEQGSPVVAAAFAPDGRSFATGGFDSIVSIWNSDGALEHQLEDIDIDDDSLNRTQTAAPNTSAKRDLRIFALAYSPNSKLLASGHADKRVRIWDVDSHTCIHRLRGSPGHGNHEGMCSCVAFSYDGTRLATGCLGATSSVVRVWDMLSPDLPCILSSQPDGHGFHLKSVAFSPLGDMLISGSEDCTAVVWTIAEGKLLNHLRLGTKSFPTNTDEKKGHTGGVLHVGFAYTGLQDRVSRAITGSMDGSIKIWALEDAQDGVGKCLRTVRLSGPATSLSFLPRGDGIYDEHCFIANSGKAIFKVDTSRQHCPTLSPQDLLKFVIEPDLRDKKSERTTEWLQRLQGSKTELDFSGCLLQRLNEKGETALHLAIDQGNRSLAQQLAMARGGRTAMVMSMDHSGNTPWSKCTARYCLSAGKIERMSTAKLEEHLRWRQVDFAAERLDNDKQKRERLKKESSLAEYEIIVRDELDFEEALSGISCGIFRFVTAEKNNPGMIAVPDLKQPTLCEVIRGRNLSETEYSGSLGYGKATILTTLVDHAERGGDKGFTIFDNPLGRALVEHDWTLYAKGWYTLEMLLYLTMMVCYTFSAIVAQGICDTSEYATDSNGTMGRASSPLRAVLPRLPMGSQLSDDDSMYWVTMWVSNVVTAALFLRFMVHSANQLYRRRVLAIQNSDERAVVTAWDIYQILSYLIGLASTSVHVLNIALLDVEWWAGGEGLCEGSAQELHACAGGLLWMGFLFYMRGYEMTSAAVPIIRQIIFDVLPFIVVLSTVLVGCALIFMNLQRRISTLDETIAAKYQNAGSSLLSAFSMMLGGFETSDFVQSEESVVVFVIFMIFVQLVMLNMLIAIMGDSVAQVMEDQKAAALFSRAQIILNSQDFAAHNALRLPRPLSSWATTPPPNQEFFGLQKKQRGTIWSGTLHAIKGQVDMLNKTTTTKLTGLWDSIENLKLDERDDRQTLQETNDKIERLTKLVEQLVERTGAP